MSDALRPRRAIERMAPYHPPTGGRAGNLRLDFNENTVGCSPRVIEFLRSAASPETMAVYPEYVEARRDLAEFFGVKPGEMLFSNGTDGAIHGLMQTYVDPGDRVVLLRPSYAMYRFYAEIMDAEIVEVDYRLPRLEFPLEALLEAITPETRVVVVSNPNNPTGVAAGPEAVRQILEKAKNSAVLIDEAYFEFFGFTALPWLERYPNLFVSRTFSKTYGMAGLRMGVLFSQEANMAYLHKSHSPYSVNTLAVLAAREAVKDREYVERYVRGVKESREMLYRALERLGIDYIPSAANFVLTLVGKRATELRDAFRGRAILVRDRSYEIPGGLRITLGTPEQTSRLIEELERLW